VSQQTDTYPPYGAGPPVPPPPAPARRSTGKIIGIVVAVLVVLAGLAVGALLLFGKSTLDQSKIQSEIVRITQDAAGIAPTAVTCPSGVEAKAGNTFTCTATLDGQPVSYTVSQDDDKGNVHIQSSGFVAVPRIEQLLTDRVGAQSGVTVTAECADGKQVVVGGPGTTISCTVTNSQDAADTLQVTGTVTDLNGTVDFG
jgi:hypothetical protein